MERDTPVVEIALIEGASNSQGTQHRLPEINTESSGHLEDDRLIARARAVGVDYEWKQRIIGEKDRGETKEEYRNRRKGCVKLLEIYHNLHLEGQVRKKIVHTVLFVHLKWSR